MQNVNNHQPRRNFVQNRFRAIPNKFGRTSSQWWWCSHLVDTSKQFLKCHFDAWTHTRPTNNVVVQSFVALPPLLWLQSVWYTTAELDVVEPQHRVLPWVLCNIILQFMAMKDWDDELSVWIELKYHIYFNTSREMLCVMSLKSTEFVENEGCRSDVLNFSPHHCTDEKRHNWRREICYKCLETVAAGVNNTHPYPYCAVTEAVKPLTLIIHTLSSRNLFRIWKMATRFVRSTKQMVKL